MSDTVVIVVVDVLGALHAGSLAGNIYGFDSATISGSTGAGTGSLRTAVAEGDRVAWVAVPMECEATVRIVDIQAADIVTPMPDLPLPGGALGRRVAHISEPASYSLALEVGRNGRRLDYADGFSLVPKQEFDVEGDPHE